MLSLQQNSFGYILLFGWLTSDMFVTFNLEDVWIKQNGLHSFPNNVCEHESYEEMILRVADTIVPDTIDKLTKRCLLRCLWWENIVYGEEYIEFFGQSRWKSYV